MSRSLDSALTEILGQVESCTYPQPRPALPGSHVDPSLVDVKYVASDGRAFRIPKVDEADCARNRQGWVWSPTGQFLLCEATCSLVAADDASHVAFAVACPYSF